MYSQQDLETLQERISQQICKINICSDQNMHGDIRIMKAHNSAPFQRVCTFLICILFSFIYPSDLYNYVALIVHYARATARDVSIAAYL